AQAAKKAAEAAAAAAADGGAGAEPAASAAPAAALTPDEAAAAAKKAAIAAAMERARAQRAQVQPQNTDALTPEQQQEVASIEARRARLKEIAHTEMPQAEAGAGDQTTLSKKH
ncbi:MAG: electron transport complex subunit RsxC, partial [Betaproteobacteria bacterium]|nr:electron transport complex subunit RsxC [Betaproteobacteria bacterium]